MDLWFILPWSPWPTSDSGIIGLTACLPKGTGFVNPAFFNGLCTVSQRRALLLQKDMGGCVEFLVEHLPECCLGWYGYLVISQVASSHFPKNLIGLWASLAG